MSDAERRRAERLAKIDGTDLAYARRHAQERRYGEQGQAPLFVATDTWLVGLVGGWQRRIYRWNNYGKIVEIPVTEARRPEHLDGGPCPTPEEWYRLDVVRNWHGSFATNRVFDGFTFRCFTCVSRGDFDTLEAFKIYHGWPH